MIIPARPLTLRLKKRLTAESDVSIMLYFVYES
jgi:hypothetical protein